MTQQSFNPVKIGGSDDSRSHKLAMQARNKAAKELRAEGKKVACWTLPGQLVRTGGIGSGQPDEEFIANIYYLSY